MNQEELERLVNKSDRQLFINDLNTGFGLSQVEAEALYDRITLFQGLLQQFQRTGSDNENSCRFGRTCGKADKVLPDGVRELNNPA